MSSTSIVKKTPSAIKNAPKSNNFSWESLWNSAVSSVSNTYGGLIWMKSSKAKKKTQYSVNSKGQQVSRDNTTKMKPVFLYNQL